MLRVRATEALKRVLGRRVSQSVTLVRAHLTTCTHRRLRAWRRAFPDAPSASRSPLRPQIQRLAAEGGQTFFGYYDISPFSATSQLLLAVVAPERNRPPRRGESIAVGFFDARGGSFRPLGDTSTWCWQQGCRLQWFPKTGSEMVIYNQMVDSGYGAVVQSVADRRIVRRYGFPVYDVASAGDCAASLNFSRLHRLRPGYGYANLSDPTRGEPTPRDDGVWLLDLGTGRAELVVSLHALSEIEASPSMKGAEHYVNHLSFNPSADRLMFFHLWLERGIRHSRLLVSNRDGSDLRVITRGGKVSHYTWCSDRELLVTVSAPEGGVRYLRSDDRGERQSVVGGGVLTRDGHPSYSPDGALLLTDTYPDRYSEQQLLLYTKEERLIELGRFFSPPRFRGELRCDLHPRWDHLGQRICFDSAWQGKRALYVLEL